MLEFNQILIKNFWSYGDYETIIQLDDLGPCLITGLINDNEDIESKASNGAGKSALVEAILWCLFGRTMRIHNPGDKVINYHTGKNCVVELKFKNGDVLRRTRNVDGHNDLIFIKDGGDQSLGTNKMEQERLNKILGLDWDIFTGSTFFSQFGQSWMEISDSKRKDALEREFKMDRIQIYAEVAKERLDRAKIEQEKLNARLDNLKITIESTKEQITKFESASSQFNDNKKNRINEAKKELSNIIEYKNSINLPDLDQIKNKWELFNQIIEKINNKREHIYRLEKERRSIQIDLSNQRKLVEKWENKGKICPACEQQIPKNHIKQKTQDPIRLIADLGLKNNNIVSQIESATEIVSQAEKAAELKKPTITIRDAESLHNECEKLDRQIKSQENQIDKITNEENQYDTTVVELNEKLEQYKSNIDDIKINVVKFDKLILHLNYIYRAYHDRRRIKSYMLAEYIPYLNNRIAYYLSKFGFDLTIEFTNALGIKSESWGYQQFSGGECKRFDVAMMLAMFDLHIMMYGRHSNIIVFDEVDGRLDVPGAEVFADIVRSEFAPKVDSILVISQRLDMRGSLPSEIKIIREGRMSRVAEILK